MEAMGYVFMYFLRGSLPWQGLRAMTKKEKYQKIMERKLATDPSTLCRGFPEEFENYINYCKSCRFIDRVDHPYLRRQLKDLFFREGHQLDNVFDWTVLNYRTSMVHPGIQSELAAAAGGADVDAQVTVPEEEVGRIRLGRL